MDARFFAGDGSRDGPVWRSSPLLSKESPIQRRSEQVQGRNRRLRKTREFAAVRRTGRSWVNGLLVLRIAANTTKCTDRVIRADRCRSNHYRMRLDASTGADLYASTDERPGTDFDIRRQFGMTVHSRGRIDQLNDSLSVVMNSALATTSPLTSAVALNR